MGSAEKYLSPSPRDLLLLLLILVLLLPGLRVSLSLSHRRAHARIAAENPTNPSKGSTGFR